MCLPKVSPAYAVVASFAPYTPSSSSRSRRLKSLVVGIEAWLQQCMNGLAIIGPIIEIIM